MNVPKRNAKILQQIDAGRSFADVAGEFRLTPERIRGILKEREDEKRRVENTRAFLEKLRATDDPDLKWDPMELVLGLRFLKVTETAFKNYFEGEQIARISMREFMELVVSDQKDPRPGYVITPLLSMRNVGIKGFGWIINRLTALDLGLKCNQEWERRLSKLELGWEDPW